MIRVYNITFHGVPKAENEVYVGRYMTYEGTTLEPSPLRNQALDKTPKAATATFKRWLTAIIEDAHPYSQGLKELGRLHGLLVKHGELKLYCWCSPEEALTSAEPHICHAQVIAEQIEAEERAFEALIVWAIRKGPPPFTAEDVDEGNLPKLTEEEKARMDEIDIEKIIAEGMRRAREDGHAGEAEEA